MQDDPDRNHRRTSATRAYEVTTNLELPAVRRRLSLLRDAIQSVPLEVRGQNCPLLLDIPQSQEELRLEPTDRVGRRQEVVAHLGGIDDGSLCTREPHDLKLHGVLGTTKVGPRPKWSPNVFAAGAARWDRRNGSHSPRPVGQREPLRARSHRPSPTSARATKNRWPGSGDPSAAFTAAATSGCVLM